MMRCRLRFQLGMIITLGSMSLKAQISMAGLPIGINPIQTLSFPAYQSLGEYRFTHQKWFISRYAVMSAASIFYSRANVIFISTPVGMQLNRQLTNNLYAFAGVYVAPTLTNFSHSFLNSPNNQSYPGAFPNANLFSINPGIQMGLMYINDAGTFSISGSIRTEYCSYPGYPAPAPPRTVIRK